jgi:hypothetical protein
MLRATGFIVTVFYLDFTKTAPSNNATMTTVKLHRLFGFFKYSVACHIPRGSYERAEIFWSKNFITYFIKHSTFVGG